MPSITGMDSFLTGYNGPTENEMLNRSGANIPQDFINEDIFELKNNERSYNKQFFSMYQYRLNVLKKRAIVEGNRKWKDEVIDGKSVYMKEKVLDIRSEEPCWVAGTIFCYMKNKLNIMEDVEKGLDGVVPIPPKSYTEPESDIMMLEDESGRVILDGELLDRTILVTGCIVALLGMEFQPGVFKVVDIAYPTISDQLPRAVEDGTANRVAIVSGLNIKDTSDSRLKLDILKQFLTGELGGITDNKLASTVSKLIIAGNSIDSTKKDLNNDDDAYGSKNVLNIEVGTIELLDDFIHEMTETLQIDIMPGDKDPAEICLPQQPLHKAFFPQSRRYVGSQTFKSLTNPSWFQFGQTRILGTSGQNVDDIFKYLVPLDKLDESEHDEDLRLNIMEASILWQNIIPTAPDTLHCYPYDNSDPFTLTETPHVYFVGNQPSFNTKLLQLKTHEGKEVTVRLICVPDFDKTGQFVILDTKTLECEVVYISI